MLRITGQKLRGLLEYSFLLEIIYGRKQIIIKNR